MFNNKIIKYIALVMGLSLLRADDAASAEADAAFDLSECINLAMENNRTLLGAREVIREFGASQVIVRSRLLPHAEINTSYEAEGNSLDDSRAGERVASSLRLSQRLFEFGPDIAGAVRAREDLRQAIYAYEGDVRRVLARTWELYNLLSLLEAQLAARRESRAGFQAIHLRQQALFDRKLATDGDILNARLNVLNEDLAINSLKKEKLKNKVELQRLIGRPVAEEVQFAPGVPDSSIELNFAIDQAVANSVRIALSTEQLREQEREVREVYWAYGPDLRLNTRFRDGRLGALLAVDKDEDTWSADLASDYALETEERAGVEEPRWSTRLELRLPIFEGASRTGRLALERAKLRQAQLRLRDLRDEVELEATQSYLALIEAGERQRIQAERVDIARMRLQLNQELKEKGLAEESLLENVRIQFFNEQDILFKNQQDHIHELANLRRQMGYFE